MLHLYELNPEHCVTVTTASGIRSPTILAEPRKLQVEQMAPATAAMECMADGEKCVYGESWGLEGELN